MEKTYRVIVRENDNGKVNVERVDRATTGNFPNKASRVKWKAIDKRKFTYDFLNTVDSFFTK